ncbi:IPTL-CTERM sorting domain-containing protein [Allochromatium humboldtianum]|nr:IPTL-CTERM sorting domain-containing protein [Allochromatium humboldtianum]
MFRWRVEQIANNYATGPNAGNYSATSPWSSALWTVLFDVDGDGYRDLAAHLNGSSGSPSEPIDMIAGIWGNIPTQSIDYLSDSNNIKLIAHNPTAFASGSQLLNFNSNYPTAQPNTTWPSGSSTNSWDYGTTRAKLVYTDSCTEYFIDYQIPVKMLDASGLTGSNGQPGPKIDRNTPISMLFCTANSLNNPFQKDCSLNRTYIGDASKPGPFGDYLSFNKTTPYAQPIVSSVTATGPSTCSGSYSLTAKVQDTLYVNDSGAIESSIKSVKFYYWHDRDGDGTTAGDTGSVWTEAAPGSLKAGTLNTWTATWNATSLAKGKYLIGVQAVDDNTKVDDGITPSGIDNRTFSYLSGNTDGQISVGNTLVSGVTFPTHSPEMSPVATEDWYGNPDVTGIQTALIGVAINACGVAPTIAKIASSSSVVAGGTVDYTITITNPSNNSDAITVSSITDTLPAGFSFDSNQGGSLNPSASPDSGSYSLTWTFSPEVSIPKGETRTLIFRANASSVAGTYQNTAGAATSFGTITSEPVAIGVDAARLSLSKTPDTYSVAADDTDTLTYTLRYSNDSAVTVTAAGITDVLPAGVTYFGCTGGTPSCSESGGSVTWTLGDLAAGASGSVTLTIKVPTSYGATSLTNSATISATPPGGGAAVSSTASSTVAVTGVNVAGTPAFTLEKTASAVSVAPGGSVTWTITYKNYGTAAASGVVVTDTLPAGLNYASNTGGGTHSNGVVTWNIGTVAANTTGSVTVTATAAAAPFTYPNPAANKAKIVWTGDATGVTSTNDVGITGQYCSAVFYFRQGSDNLLSTIRPAILTEPSSALDYTTTVTGITDNSFEDYTSEPNQIIFEQQSALGLALDLSNKTLTVNYRLSAQQGGARSRVILRNATTNQTIATSDEINVSTGTGTWYTYSVIIPNGTTLGANDKLRWYFQFRASGGKDITFHYDSVTSNSRSSFCQTSAPANLSLSKTVDKPSVTAGSNTDIAYTLKFANTGGVDATSATIADTLPAGVTIASATLNGVTVNPMPTPTSNTYTFSIKSTTSDTAGTVKFGESGTLVINATVGSGVAAGTTLTNSAVIAATGLTSPPAATATTTVIAEGATPTPALALNLSTDKTNPLLGETVTYTLTVVNTGGSDATNVVVSNVVPTATGYTYVSCTGGCTNSGGTLTWPTIATLAPGASQSYTYTMQVAITGLLDGATVIPDTAQASATSVTEVNSNEVKVTLNASPRLTLTKSASPTTGLAPGSEIEYTLTVANTGSSSASGVTVSDTIPANTSFKAVTGGTGSFNPLTNRVTFTEASLAGNASATVKFTVTVNDLPAGTTTISNATATASAGNAASVTAPTVDVSASAYPVLTLTAAGPSTLAYPTAKLTAAATGATTIFVDDTSVFAVGQYVNVGGTNAQITAVSGNSLTLSASVTGTLGASVIGSVTHSLTLKNTGNATATAVGIVDTLVGTVTPATPWPAGSSVIATSPNGSLSGADSNIVTWTNLADLPPGASTSVQAIIMPGTTGTLTSSGTGNTSSTCNPNPCTPTATVTTEIGGLKITKRTTTPISTAGGTATWVIDVVNSLASSTVTTVSDILPSGFSYASTASVVKSDGTAVVPTASPTAGSIEPAWSLTVPANDTVSITFTANVSADTGGALAQNPATAAGAAVTPYEPLNSTQEDVTVLGSGMGNLQGYVYQDNDKDGFYDATIDTALPWQTVTIVVSGTTYTAYSNEAGYYSRVVPQGSASVTVPDQSGLTLTVPATNPATVTIPEGGTATQNFGFKSEGYPTSATITGRVYFDANNNGTFDAGETVYSGMPLTVSDGTNTWTVYTDSSGIYAKGGLPTSGSATVTVKTPPAGLNGASTANVTLAAGTLTQNFPYTSTAGNPPVNTVPDAQTIVSGVQTAISGISVADTDTNLATVRLTVGAGALNVTLSGGVTISAGADGSTTLTLSGSQAAINTVLGTLKFTGAANTTLTVLSTDATNLTDTDTVVITVTAAPAPDVQAQVDAPASAAAGGLVTTLLTFANQGTDTAEDVTYTVTLPAGLTSVDCAGATCSYSGTTLTLTGLPAVLIPGQVEHVLVSYTAPASGSASVTATIATTTSGETPTANNTATDSTTVSTSVVDVAAWLTVPPSATTGTTVTVPVGFVNLGATSATGVTYSLTLPAGLTGVTCTGSGVSCSYSGTTVTITGLPVTLAPGQAVDLTLTYIAPATGPVAVTATVSATGDPDTAGNNSATDSTAITASAVPDVLSSVAPPASAPAGATVTVPLVYRNLGPAAAPVTTYNLTFSDAAVAANSIEIRNNGALCTYAGNALTGCGLPATLNPGQAVELVLTYTSPASGTVTVTSTIAATGETHTANNASTGSTDISATAVANVYTTVDVPASVPAGGNVQARVTFGNQGESQADGVTYAVVLAPGLSGVSCSGAACVYDSATGILTLTGLPTSLPPGQSATVLIDYLAPATGASSLEIQSRIDTASAEATTNDNAAGAGTAVTGSAVADVTTWIDAPAAIASGATSTVNAGFTNLGTASATGVTYTLTFTGAPTNVSVTHQGTACTYTAGTGAVTGCGLPTTLTAGQRVDLAATYTAPTTGPVVATSTVGAANDSDTGNNTASASTAISAATTADVTAAVAPPASATAGSTVTVPFSFANLGPAAAADVGYSLTLTGSPTNQVITYNGATCTYSGGAITGCDLPATLAPGQTLNLTLTYTAPGSAVGVTAAVTTSTSQSSTANDSASGSTGIVAAPTVDVYALVDAPATATGGAAVDVTLTFGNAGNSTANGVTYSALLPAGLTGVSCTAGATACTYDSASGVVTITFATNTLASSATQTATLRYTAPLTAGTVDVIARVSATGDPGTGGNNSASDTTLVNAAPTAADMGIAFSGFPAAASPGATVTGTVTCPNAGPAAATQATCSVTGGTLSNCSLALPVASLANGASVSCTVTATAPTTGLLSLSGSTSTTSTDGNVANNTAGVSAKVVDAVDDAAATLTQSVSGTETYDLLTNDRVGTDPATIANVTPSLVGLTKDGQAFTDTRGWFTLNAGGQFVAAKTADVGVYVVTYRICANPATTPPACDTATKTITVSLAALPDLTLAKTHTGDFVQGQTGAQYILTVTNSGTGPTTGTVTVSDTLPTGLTATAISGSGWACVLSTLTCSRSDVLEAESSYPAITLTVDVAADAPASVTNTASVSGGGDVTPDNNTASDVTTIGSGPDLVLIKSHTGDFSAGQRGAIYTLRVTNQGGQTTSGSVTVTDTLPTGLTATAFSGGGWTCTLTPLSCSRADALAAGASYPPITLTVDVAAEAPTSVTNSAGVSGGGDINPDNNSAEDETRILGLNGRISGRVFADLDGDGVQGPGEPGISGVLVTLTSVSDGSNSSTTLTDSSGRYQFDPVVPGSYILVETDPPNYASTTLNNIPASVAANGEVVVDFGDQPLGTISGRVFEDINGDGLLNGAETGLAGVTVILTNEQGATRTAVTDANGLYLFDQVSVGRYSVRETDPDGYVSTTLNLLPVRIQAFVLNGQAVASAANANFGDQRSSSVSGRVFADNNGDGLQDGGALGIANVLVELRGQSDTLIRSTRTGPDGSYRFDGLDAGAYSVVETDLDRWFSTTSNRVAINLAAGGGATVNFGDQLRGTVSGRVFRDLDGNGQQGSAEYGLADVTVTLRSLTGSGLLLTAMTNTVGEYLFDSIPAGAYEVVETDPVGYVSTTTNRVAVSLAAEPNGQVGAATANFGDQPRLAISGRVFMDLSGNGVQEQGENGLGGILVTLKRDGVVLATALTAGNGAYLFSDLPPGVYRVERDIIPDHLATSPTPLTVSLSIDGSATANFGVQPIGLVYGRVVIDTNGNGRVDTGELGVGGIRIDLLSTNAASGWRSLFGTAASEALRLEITSGDGRYLFLDVEPENYTVVSTPPANFVNTTPIRQNVTVTLTTPGRADFGLIRYGSITGRVFQDLNDNDVDDDEPGLGGVLIELTDSTGTLISSTRTSGDGYFLFEDLDFGDYILIETDPSGFTSTSGLNRVEVRLDEERAATALSFPDRLEIDDPVRPPPSPNPIPTLSEWALILLMLSMLGLALRFHRTRPQSVNRR